MTFEGLSANEWGTAGSSDSVDAVEGANRFAFGSAGVSLSSLCFNAGYRAVVIRSGDDEVRVRSGRGVFRLLVKGGGRALDIGVARVRGARPMFVNGDADGLFNDVCGGGVAGSEGFCAAPTVFRLAGSGLNQRGVLSACFLWYIADDGLLVLANANDRPVFLLLERLRKCVPR